MGKSRTYAVWMLLKNPPKWERFEAFSTLERAQAAVRQMLTIEPIIYIRGHVEQYGKLLWRAVSEESQDSIAGRENAEEWEIVRPW